MAVSVGWPLVAIAIRLANPLWSSNRSGPGSWIVSNSLISVRLTVGTTTILTKVGTARLGALVLLEVLTNQRKEVLDIERLFNEGDTLGRFNHRVYAAGFLAGQENHGNMCCGRGFTQEFKRL